VEPGLNQAAQEVGDEALEVIARYDIYDAPLSKEQLEGFIAWESGISDDLRNLLSGDPDLAKTFARLDPQGRDLLSQVSPNELPSYGELIGQDLEKGKKLLGIGNFTSFDRFQRVFNAVGPEDLDRMISVFDGDYLGSLSPRMRERYQRLLDEVATGDLSPTGPEFRQRLEVLEEVKKLRSDLGNALGPLSNRAKKKIGISSRNIAYGDFDISLPNGKKITGEYVSVFGENTSNSITQGIGEESLNQKEIIPDIDESQSTFTPSNPRRAHDSERKLFEDIISRMEDELGLPLDRDGRYAGMGFSGQVEVLSEMEPCDSCETIITEQFKSMFGEDIDVVVQYGVEFDIEPDARYPKPGT